MANTNVIDNWLNKVHCGDCIELMKQMPEQSIDLVVTSPPYNLRESTGGGLRNGSGGTWENAQLLKGYDGDHLAASDDMPYPQYVEWQRECLRQMMRLVKPTGAIFYNHKWRVQDGVLQDRHEIIKDLPFPVRQIIIWARKGGLNFNCSYFLPTYEVIYLFCQKPFRLARTGDGKGKGSKKSCTIGDVWHVTQETKNSHPAPFPVEIPRNCIVSTDAKIVLDPFMGSGTTAIACKELGRHWVGIEVSKKYCNLAERRINGFSCNRK